MSSFPAIVNRIPPGLLSLLGLKNTGRNPAALSAELRGVIELRDWYLASIAQTIGQSGTVNNVQNQFITFAPTLQVPDTEWWFLHYSAAAFTVDSAFGAANRFSAFLQWTVNGNALRGPITEQGSAIPGQYPIIGLDGLFLPPGSVAAMRVDATAAVNPTATAAATASAYITRLPI